MRDSRHVLIACVLVMAACRGKLVATAELHGAGTAEARFHATGAPLILWADTDGKWRGNSKSHLPVHYDVDVLAGGANSGHVSCDTKDSRQSVCGVHVSSGDVQRGDCELKLACRLPAVPAGDIVLRVKGEPGKSATEVKKLSINVREE
jgi:hypothetical protein